jgi:deoxyribodipyrimidine photolyase-related protein
VGPQPGPFTEDDIDRDVRRDLDAWQRSGEIRLTGRDGPREFPVTRAEAQATLQAFVRDRPAFRAAAGRHACRRPGDGAQLALGPIGWRDYVWQLYWHFGEVYRRRNALRAHTPLPSWFTGLDAESVSARCLSDALA